jgi:hypothetical protein
MVLVLPSCELSVQPESAVRSTNSCILVPSSHALARKSAVRLRETANETYVLYDRVHAPGLHDFVLGILTIVAWAGVGKSTLIDHWLRRMAAEKYRSAELVFGWSFYRQGTSGGTVHR